jgi:predicted outer membrane repeat protein
MKNEKTNYKIVVFTLFLAVFLAVFVLGHSFAADTNITNSTAGGLKNAVNQSVNNDRIILSDGTYTGDNNTGIVINKNLTITGTNKANTVLDLSGGSKLFTINSNVRLTLSNLTIKNAMIGNNSFLINNNGYLSIENSIITDNTLSFNIRENTTYTSNDVLENDSFETGYLIGNNGQMNIINSAFINNNMNINYQYYENVPYTANTTLYFNNTIYNSSVVGSGFIVNKGRLNITRSEFTNNTIKTTINRQYNWNNDQNITIDIRNPNGELVIGDQNTYYTYAMIVNTGDLIITQSNFQNNINNLNETRYYNENTTMTIDGSTRKKSATTTIYNLIYSSSNLEVNNSNFTTNGYNVTFESNNPNYYATRYGGVIYMTTLANSTANIAVTDSIFTNNTATTSGGGVYVTSGINGTVTVNIVNSTFVNNTANNNGGGVYVISGINGSVSVDILNSTFVNNTATTSGGGVYVTSGGNGTVSVDILSSTFVNNTATSNGGGVYVISGINGTVSVDIVSSTFVNNAANRGKAIYVTNRSNGNVSVVVNYNAFLNQSSGTIYKPSTSSAVVDADYNYWGFNGVPTDMTNVVVNNYYVLNITNMSDLGADYTVGDLLSFNYTVYLNGTSDSTNASNLPSINSIFYNNLLYGYFNLNALGVIEVPVQIVASDVFNFTNANGTVIGSFTLTGTISPGSVNNITVPSVIIVNNTTADLVISIPFTVGGLAGQTFNVTINGQTQTVTFANGTGIFVGYQYGNLGLNSLNITLSGNPNYNNSSAINNVFFKEETNINANINDTIYGENTTIVINITTNGQPIADGTYTLIINGVEYNVTFSNGIGQVILSGLNAGEYNYTILFNSTDKYTESETNITINVIKANVNIGVNLPSNATYGGNSTISGNLTTNGSLLKGTYNITVTVNGVNYNVTVIDGLWSLTIPNTGAGTANVKITFPENNNYNRATIAGTYLIKPANKNTVITITTSRKGNTITYKFTLKDSNGNVLANQNIKVTISVLGKTLTLKTNNAGMAQYTFTASKSGKYQANATYNGLTTTNIIYNKSTKKSSTIEVKASKIRVAKVQGKTVKKRSYKIYYRLYTIKNYGDLTGSRHFKKYFKAQLKSAAKKGLVYFKYNKKTKLLKTLVKNLKAGKIVKVKLKFYKPTRR